MEKPKSLSVKDFLIRTLAVKLMVPEKTIEAVVAHQFSEANLALRTNDSLEISGFGKFLFNHKKGEKKIQKLFSQKRLYERWLADETISENKRRTTQMRLATILNNINSLKPRYYDSELFADGGGMEEQAHSTSPSEGAN